MDVSHLVKLIMVPSGSKRQNAIKAMEKCVTNAEGIKIADCDTMTLGDTVLGA